VTHIAKILPTLLAKVIPPRETNESGAHYAAIEALRTAIQPDTNLVTVRRARADAAKTGREMPDIVRDLERRRKPEAPAIAKFAKEPLQRGPDPPEEPADLTQERLGGCEKRRRILDSAPSPGLLDHPPPAGN
jgi:hypothetical protein